MNTTRISPSISAANYRDYADGAYRFGLSSLMLLVTLVSLLMGALTLVAPLGVLLVVLSVLAVARTVCEVRRRLNRGCKVGTGDKTILFMVHLAGVSMVLATALLFLVIAFGAGMAVAVTIYHLFDSEVLSVLGGFFGFLAACVPAVLVTIQSVKATRP